MYPRPLWTYCSRLLLTTGTIMILTLPEPKLRALQTKKIGYDSSALSLKRNTNSTPQNSAQNWVVISRVLQSFFFLFSDQEMIGVDQQHPASFWKGRKDWVQKRAPAASFAMETSWLCCVQELLLWTVFLGINGTLDSQSYRRYALNTRESIEDNERERILLWSINKMRTISRSKEWGNSKLE